MRKQLSTIVSASVAGAALVAGTVAIASPALAASHAPAKPAPAHTQGKGSSVGVVKIGDAVAYVRNADGSVTRFR